MLTFLGAFLGAFLPLLIVFFLVPAVSRRFGLRRAFEGALYRAWERQPVGIRSDRPASVDIEEWVQVTVDELLETMRRHGY